MDPAQRKVLTSEEEEAVIDDVREEIKFRSRRGTVAAELVRADFVVVPVPFTVNQWDVHVNTTRFPSIGKVSTFRVWQRPEDNAFETIEAMTEIPL